MRELLSQRARRVRYLHSSTGREAGRYLCRQIRRSSTQGSDLVRPNGITQLANRKLVSVTGKDAPNLLQGLVTSNIETLLEEDTAGHYSAFLNAQGRLLTDAFIYRIPNRSAKSLEDGFWVEVEDSLVKILCQYLRRHKLRSEVKVEPLGSKYNIWVAWGDQTSEHTQSSEYITDSDIVSLPDPRLPGFAHRFVVPETSDLENSRYDAFSQLEKVTSNDYLLRRCIWGLTEGHQAMLDGRALPHEFNLDVLNAIDFKKGCYIGQELTIRTQHQGVVRKRILPIITYPSDENPPSDITISTAVDMSKVEMGRKVKRIISEYTELDIPRRRRNDAAGTWVEGLHNVGLGLCRLEMMTDVRVTADQDAKSFTRDTEFEFDNPEESVPMDSVKVKALVPEWLRSKIKPRQDRKSES